jgi:hypothetical protein
MEVRKNLKSRNIKWKFHCILRLMFWKEFKLDSEWNWKNCGHFRRISMEWKMSEQLVVQISYIVPFLHAGTIYCIVLGFWACKWTYADSIKHEHVYLTLKRSVLKLYSEHCNYFKQNGGVIGWRTLAGGGFCLFRASGGRSSNVSCNSWP